VVTTLSQSQGLHACRIVPWLAKQHRTWQWTGAMAIGVERTFTWLNQFRRLRVRYEKRADIHEAFLSPGYPVISWRFLRVDWVAAFS
jgi:hypothetical protein